MTIQIEFWQVISLFISFFGFLLATGKIGLGIIDRMLQDRFRAQEEQRSLAHVHWDKRFEGLEAAAAKEASQWQAVERDLLQLKAELPVQYVRREDFIRVQSVIETKLDAVALRIENLQLRANKDVR
jgi:hypothetical protein